MSIFSDLLSGVGDLGKSLIGGYKDNKDWLNPVIGGIGNYMQGNSVNSGMDSYRNLLANSITNDYNNQKANRDAYLAWLQGNAASSAANRAAAAAAANATDANRRKALAKAQKTLNAGYADARGVLQPYVNAGLSTLPLATGAYASGIGGLGSLLSAYMSGGISKPNPAASIYDMNLPVPKR